MILNKSSGTYSSEELLRFKQASQRYFYDLEDIKQIPILDVCRNMLGLECVQRSGKTWCKARQERTASTLLHLDSNSFHDFGSNTHGDVIGLVCHVLNTDWKTAVSQLAQSYHIKPLEENKDTDPYELSLWDYECIGIAGDKAVKNFSFDIDRLPIERLYELSEKYSMSMNELRKKHPKIYEKILLQKALPFVRSLRNEYYLDVWSRYQMMCAISKPSLFFQEDQLAYFKDQIKELKTAEWVLRKAIHDTSIQLQPVKDYVPAMDLEYLSKGKIKPVMGSASYKEMAAASQAYACGVKYRSVDYDGYIKHMMGCPLFYSAFLNAGRVVIGYLEKDQLLFEPYFKNMGVQSFSNSNSNKVSARRKARNESSLIESQGER